jgi:4a-hydroxytetrahydrobiopterin dehydratase
VARLLDDKEIETRMSGADMLGWRREGDTLHRTVQAYDFPTAVRIVDKVVIEAQKLDDRPEIDIHGRQVHFAIRSDAGLTDVDVELAHRIETAAGSYIRGRD